MIKRQFQNLKEMGLKKYFRHMFLENRSDRQTVFKNTFWLFLAEGVNKGLMFLLTILIARYLGAEGYGQFAFAMSFTALFAVVADFGLSTLTIREVARDKSLARKYIDNIAVIKLVLGLITFGLIIVVIQFLGKTPEIKTLVYLTGIWTIIQGFTQFFQSIFRAFEKMQYEALSKIIYSLLLFGMAFFMIWQDLGIKSIVQSYVYASLIAFIFTLILVRKKFTKFFLDIDFKFWKEALKESWMIGLILYLITIYTYIDQVFLYVLTTSTEVGIYSVAVKLMMGIGIFSFVIMNSLFPLVSKIHDKFNIALFYKRNLKKIFLYSLIVCLLFFILGKEIIVLLFGNEYTLSYSVFRILILASFFEFFIFFGYISLLAANETKIILIYKILSATTNIILNLIFIPIFGIYGAATATVISYFELAILNHLKINKMIKHGK